MPYVPSKKTDGKSTDREILDAAVEKLAQKAAGEITNNFSLIEVYRKIFITIASALNAFLKGEKWDEQNPETELAKAIWGIGQNYGYEGAFLGELNYPLTRFIQRVPQIKVKKGEWEEKNELRYWLYAATVKALTDALVQTQNFEGGISSIFEDVKDEYKWRVNRSYEVAQILKSGDCYDTPYYSRVIEVVDEDGKHIGHMEVMLKRSEETLNKDILDGQIVIKKKK